MKVVPEALQYIKLQRTHTDPKNYVADIQKEADALIPYLNWPSSVLSIGTGMAGLEIMMHEFFSGFKLFVIEGSEVGTNRYGYANTIDFYNDERVTAAMLRANGVTDYMFNPPTQKVDLVVSFYSLGFHYPYSKYAKIITDALPKGGQMVLDIRKRENKLDIPDGFKIETKVFENRRYARVVLVRV